MRKGGLRTALFFCLDARGIAIVTLESRGGIKYKRRLMQLHDTSGYALVFTFGGDNETCDLYRRHRIFVLSVSVVEGPPSARPPKFSA